MLKLNTNRTFTVPVPVTYVDEEGSEQTGKFTATYKILSGTEAEHPDNTGKRLLEMVVVKIHDDLELFDKESQKFEGEDLKAAAIADPTLAAAMVTAYWDNAVKKPKPKT
ncbi:MAG: hypothetical protein ABW152_18095 [Candidatus Thiodiazotropha endolucinida]